MKYMCALGGRQRDAEHLVPQCPLHFHIQVVGAGACYDCSSKISLKHVTSEMYRCMVLLKWYWRWHICYYPYIRDPQTLVSLHAWFGLWLSGVHDQVLWNLFPALFVLKLLVPSVHSGTIEALNTLIHYFSKVSWDNPTAYWLLAFETNKMHIRARFILCHSYEVSGWSFQFLDHWDIIVRNSMIFHHKRL